MSEFLPADKITTAGTSVDSAALTKLRDAVRRFIPELESSGSQPTAILEQIVQFALEVQGVRSSAIYLKRDLKDESQDWKLEVEAGEQSLPPPEDSPSTSGSRRKVSTSIRLNGQTLQCRQFGIFAGGKVLGWLIVSTDRAFSEDTEVCFLELAHFASVAVQALMSEAQLKHFASKVEVLNELNKLVASGAGLDRICRTVAREAAFRFAADCVISLLLSESGEELEVKGCYGCPPKKLPANLSTHGTQLGNLLRIGGILSVPDLMTRKDSGLSFLTEFGVCCFHCIIVETQGQKLGAIVIGFRDEVVLSEHDSSMLDEFARGAAVALLNSKSQDKLTAYTEKLEELVEGRTADLAIQTARADEANRAKSEFVANISHELRTPLTAIVGYSSILNEGMFGPVNNEQREALQSIIKAAEHLRELIDDVLNVSKIEAGKEECVPSEVFLEPLMTQIHKLMLQTAAGKGVQLLPLSEKIKTETTKLWVDPRHIRQILINLMSNAVKYTPAGGSVTLATELVGDKAKITVTDTGVGITHAQQLKLFARYERLDDAYSRAQTGTGIGLSLTKHLVEINGGAIGVDSEVGKGSAFWIMLPLADANSLDTSSSTDQTATQEEVMARLDGLNVLIVDDNQSTCEVLRTLVTSAGGTPYVATSAAEARNIVLNTLPDAALVDLAMPGENGLDLIRHFRKDEGDSMATMPIIVVSACVFDHDRRQAAESGASLFIAKPFRPTEVINSIRDLTTAAVLGESPSSLEFKEKSR